MNKKLLKSLLAASVDLERRMVYHAQVIHDRVVFVTNAYVAAQVEFAEAQDAQAFVNELQSEQLTYARAHNCAYIDCDISVKTIDSFFSFADDSGDPWVSPELMTKALRITAAISGSVQLVTNGYATPVMLYVTSPELTSRVLVMPQKR